MHITSNIYPVHINVYTWVHKKCSGLQRLTPNPDYRVARCIGNAHPIDRKPQNEVQVRPDKLKVVASFCYLSDMLSAGGGCVIAVTTHVKTAWKKFRELLPNLTSRHLSYKTRGHVYSSCVQSAMLHPSETWPLTKTNLQRYERVIIRQICSIKPEDVETVRSSELLAKLELEDLALILREREGFTGLGMWSVLVVQSEQHVIYRLMAGGGGREA